MFASRTATFALLTRSLREDNRLKQTYFARGGLICFILLMLWASQNSYGYVGAPGLRFFSQVVMTNFFFITLTGLSYFASAISEEKEEGTLGLLRMTNLGPLTILLGKSSSRLLGVALLLLVQLPFTLLAVTLGGVSLHQVFTAYVSLGAYIFLACNLALLFSVVCARVGAASAATAVSLLLFFFGPFCVLGIIGAMTTYYHLATPPGAVVRALVWGSGIVERASAYAQLERILTNGFTGPLFGFQVRSNLALGAGFFGLAWWGFDRFTRERRPGVLGPKLPSWRLSRVGMLGARRAWGLAVGWKDFFLLHGGWSAAVAKSLGYGGIVWLLYDNVKQQYRGTSYTVSGLEMGGRVYAIFMLIFGVEMAIGASRIFHAEIQGKTLAGLVGLPAPVRRIAYQKVGALLLSGVPALAFASAGLVLIVANSSTALDETLASDGFWIAILTVGVQGLLFVHVAAFLSLSIKRLSLAVAVMVMIMGNMLFTAIAGVLFRFGPAEGTMVLYHCGLLALTAFIHVKIGTRLKQLAAAEG